MSDRDHDTLGDRLRSLGTQMSAPALPAAEIRRRADRRRHRRRALAVTAACTSVVLGLALPSVLRSPGPQQRAAGADSSSAPASPHPTAASSAPSPFPTVFTVTSTATAPIDAGTTAEILGSCLGSEASQYHAVIALRTPVASPRTDGVVVAVDSAGQYVQCQSKGSKGTSSSVPPTFINDRLWGVGHLVEFFDGFSEQAGAGKFLSLDAGHYTPDVAKITISYGDDPTQYPAVMAGGAFVHAAAVSPGLGNYVSSYVHAYDADGKEIYNQKTQPNGKNTRR
ncbi:hypothetical protein ACIRD3_11195 [Kitasatospora sp. NPDC093550]|uniref:hypothetical protein n=1 Tax=Kitasatospora sp. NPDC093550 TaxID=3364089 RepID=UPI0037FF8D8B